jgi:SAM-dependent methyltransferase
VSTSGIHLHGDWDAYYRATAGRMPSPWFIRSLPFIDGNHGSDRLVVDLGCGNGVETKAFLDRGWRVVAIDREPTAIELTVARATDEQLPRLTAVVTRYADISLPNADVVFAQLSLPFCAEETFPSMWEKIRAAIVPGGYFVGQFLGPEDEWSGQGVLVHTLDEVEGLFEGWEIAELSEQEHEGVAGANREPKYWHIISVIARRPGEG